MTNHASPEALKKKRAGKKPRLAGNFPSPNKSGKRIPWSSHEIDLLKDGVAKYGKGAWHKIVIEFFSEGDGPTRTNVNLKVGVCCREPHYVVRGVTLNLDCRTNGAISKKLAWFN